MSTEICREFQPKNSFFDEFVQYLTVQMVLYNMPRKVTIEYDLPPSMLEQDMAKRTKLRHEAYVAKIKKLVLYPTFIPLKKSDNNVINTKILFEV